MSGIMGVIAASYVAGSSVTTKFNSATKYPTIVLTNSDRTINSGETATWRSAQAIPVQTSGKWYFECVFAYSVAGVFGISKAGADLSTFSGNALDTLGYVSTSGAIFLNGVQIATIPTWIASDRMGCAYDLGTNTVWFSKNNTFSGNPAAGTGGISLGSSGFGVPMGSVYTLGDTVNIQGISGGATYSPPSGFTTLP